MPRLNRRTITRSTTTPGRSEHHRKVNYTRPKTGQPQVSSVHITTTSTPAETVATTENAGASIPGISGTVTMNVLAASALMVFSQWDGFFKPMLHMIWLPFDAGASPPTIDIRLIAGMFVFVIGVGIISAMGEDEAGVMMIMLVALWLLFIMFQGQGTVKRFFGFFNPGTTKTKTTTTQSSTGTQHGATGAPASPSTTNA